MYCAWVAVVYAAHWMPWFEAREDMDLKPTLLLTAEELQALTGYRQRTRQLAWLQARLAIKAPQRADGLPVVSRAQLEAALAGKAPTAEAGPKWSKMPA
jgi:hypothetical protein